MGQTDENKALIRRLGAALFGGHPEALDEHPGYWQTRKMLPRMLEAFPDLSQEIQAQVAEGEMVATFTIMRGTHRGSFFGADATGRRVTFQHLDMDRVVDGKVVEHNGESGWLSVLIDVGVLPPPP
jgi:predicted ester cyclase